jgi:hypothetical protein
LRAEHDIVHDLTCVEGTNEDAWLVFEATSAPGFFKQAQNGLDKLRAIESAQLGQRESSAQMILMNSLRNAPYKVEIYVTVKGQEHRVFAVMPGNAKKPITSNLKPLLMYLFLCTDARPITPVELVDRFKSELTTILADSIKRVNSTGMGSSLRGKQGDLAYDGCVEAVNEYLLPKLLRIWLSISEGFVQNFVDRLAAAPMVLTVGGQLKQFFQIEYPRWKFRVVGSRIVPEKVADCNVAVAAGKSKNTMSMTFSYIGGDDFHTDTKELEFERTNNCRLILKDGSVFLSDEKEPLFAPPAPA